MSDNFIEHLTNPTRSKIFFEIQSNPQITTKALLKKLPDIAQPTLYRHIKAMLDGRLIKVTGEKQIRGAIEKSYSINIDFDQNIERIVTENDGKAYLQMFTQYIMGIIGEFKMYSETKNINIINDGSTFTTAPFYATTEELHEALMQIGDIVQSLVSNEPTMERSLRNFCTITTPPKKY